MVMKDCPVLLAEVVTMGRPTSAIIFPNQWSGKRRPRVVPPTVTDPATAVACFSFITKVYGPGSFCSHCSASRLITQCWRTQAKEGTHTEKGWEDWCFRFRIFVTAFVSRALPPRP